MMWSKDPSSFVDDVVLKDGSKLVKDIVGDMHSAVVNLSPIDTTNFVGNTNLTIGEPDYTYVEGKTIGRAGARAAGVKVIESIPDDKLVTVSIANGTPYGQYLEGLHGKPHSAQAPNGVYLTTFKAISMWYK